MRILPKPRGPSGFDAFRRVAQRGIPFTAVGGRAFMTVPAQSLGDPTPRDVRAIDRFASQNLPPSLQPEAKKEFSPT